MEFSNGERNYADNDALSHRCPEDRKTQRINRGINERDEIKWALSRSFNSSKKSSRPPERSHPYVGGLPSGAKTMPFSSAAFRSLPAFFIASCRSGPGGIARASCKAANACASKSRSGRWSFFS